MLVRGKDTGHDIDLLISHPDEGREVGLLQQLISVLERCDVLLQGRWERSTFSAEDFVNEAMNKPSNLKNTLDHFEKWIGIVKVDVGFHSDESRCPADTEVTARGRGKCCKCSVICCYFRKMYYIFLNVTGEFPAEKYHG